MAKVYIIEPTVQGTTLQLMYKDGIRKSIPISSRFELEESHHNFADLYQSARHLEQLGKVKIFTKQVTQQNSKQKKAPFGTSIQPKAAPGTKDNPVEVGSNEKKHTKKSTTKKETGTEK